MMENIQMTNLQKVLKLFSEVNGRKKDLPSRDNDQNAGRFFGKIGPDITFNGKWTGTAKPDAVLYKYETEKISLAVNGDFLATIVMKRGSDEFCKKRNQLPRTLFEIYTPNCGEKSCISKDTEGLNQVRVYHAPDETFDGVFDEIWDAVALSKAKEAYNRKFGKLNLGSSVVGLKNKNTKCKYQQPDDTQINDRD